MQVSFTDVITMLLKKEKKNFCIVAKEASLVNIYTGCSQDIVFDFANLSKLYLHQNWLRKILTSQL